MDIVRSTPCFATFSQYYASKRFLELNKEYKTMTTFAMTLEVHVTLLLVFNGTQLCTIPELTWVQVQNLPAF
jgi:hypothetical protein